MSNTTGWIKCSDRIPTKEDASGDGLVLYRNTSNGADGTYSYSRLSRDETHILWHPWPKPPEPELNPVCPECGNSKLELRPSACVGCICIECTGTGCRFFIRVNTKTLAIELCNALPRKK